VAASGSGAIPSHANPGAAANHLLPHRADGELLLMPAIKIWFIRTLDGGTTWETIDPSVNEADIEIAYDPESGALGESTYRRFAVPPGKFLIKVRAS